ncbi:YqaA family protein [Aliarcobacter thereius]|uniref:Inner membrane protein YqaA n=2 Tax=Aliarcobacter thereius TaxID=544718 RepID=A0A1C0BA77_9BACT|nr:YqaA family protein [Aliarcobacter thereius]OCL91878.1 Inner membrane protein YqaA [Aliarcobacter thereius]OCL95024.1 Inner membrane protein YqaA [Aliarcobacter thereius LMG 24486]OCM00472.1 Inner membrane protein YqaA [Aliarcobacter thereius]QBF15105.1 membrane protein YqaA, SNARE-associated domain [Aliarcobacter thereius LMG 24486]TLS92923.1 DedA family protein [Aliarcobacter thereius]
MTYFILFISAFLSATLLPFGSEALLIYDIKAGYNIYLLLFFGTLGNSLGSVLNYYLGLKGEEYLIKKRLINIKYIDICKKYFDKYGGISILFVWLPIIGDPITFVAGILKYNFKKFLVLLVISKLSRYLFIALII